MIMSIFHILILQVIHRYMKKETLKEVLYWEDYLNSKEYKSEIKPAKKKKQREQKNIKTRKCIHINNKDNR